MKGQSCLSVIAKNVTLGSPRRTCRAARHACPPYVHPSTIKLVRLTNTRRAAGNPLLSMAKPHILTRRELYELVWSTPLSKLAGDFGLSDVSLKRVCDQHRVPTPARGYWAKREAGQSPKQTLFVEVADARLNRVEVHSALFALPEPVRQVIETQRAARKLRAPKPPIQPFQATEVVTDAHPAVRRTARTLRQGRSSDTVRSAYGEGLCGVEVGCASVERVICVLDIFPAPREQQRGARALDERGLPLTPAGRTMQVERGRERIVFALKERAGTVKHVPTEAELAEEARRQVQRDRHWRNPERWPLSPDGRAYPETDTLRTGELLIQVESYVDGMRRTWADGRTQRLEDLVPSIVDGFEVLLAARKARREAGEEQERQWAELARRHERARARQERELARLAFVEEAMRLTREAEALRSCLATVPAEASPAGGQSERMRAWMADRLLTLEAGLRADTIEERLVAAKLFPLPAEDPLSDPPTSTD